MIRVVLTAVDEVLAAAWRRSSADLKSVDVYQGSITELHVDAVVSPANSFGFMDGGIDAVYVSHFGADIQSRVRRQILDAHHGELVVGNALIVPTGDRAIPFLIAAPTMRVPMRLGESVSPYLAARAALLLIKHGTFKAGPYVGIRLSDLISTVAIPGLGTGTGGVSAAVCAHQVRRAIKDVLFEEFRMPRSWAEASERHQSLYTHLPKRLQH